MSYKYKDYFQILFTLTNGRVIKRHAEQADVDVVFGAWPDTAEDALIDFKFIHHATLPFIIRRNMIETIEVSRVLDWSDKE